MCRRLIPCVVGLTLLMGQGSRVGAIEVVLTEGTNFALALSPDQDRIVMDLQGTLWLLPAAGGGARSLTDGLGDDRLPDWSPDGARVVFQSFRDGGWDLWSIGADGAGLEQLTRGPFDDREPVWSPDGNRIAFSSDRSGNYDLWLLDVSDGGLSRLTYEPADDTMPTWSPDGRSLAFVSERGEQDGAELWKIDLASGEASTLARLEGKIASPSWSRDGRTIALHLLRYLPLTLMGSRFDEGMESELLLVPVDGGPPRPLSAGSDIFPFRPAWTRDGNIVYTADGEIRRLVVETSERERIDFRAPVELRRPAYTKRKARFAQADENLPVRGIVRPSVSPDGSWIAFTALGDIWLVPATGGVPRALTRDEYLDSDVSWSPDGKHVVFASDREGTMDLWVKDIEASPQGGALRRTSGDGAEVAPAWSPDGKWIAYLDEGYDVYVVAADGAGEPRRVYDTLRRAGLPSWSSDSRHVAFAVQEPFSRRFREGFNRIRVISLDSRDEKILPYPEKSFGTRDGDGPVWSPDGSQMAFSMDGGIWVMPVDAMGEPTSGPRKIADGTADFLSWFPDSSRLLYLSNQELRTVDGDTGRTEVVDLSLDYRVASSGGVLLIRNATLIDGTGRAARENVDIQIQGGRISSIEPGGSLAAGDIRVIDATGKTVIPGLIEAHTHLTLPQWGARHGRVWLAHGVTSIRTMTDPTYRVLEERESIDSGRRLGPRVFSSGFALDGDRIYYNGTLSIDGPDELDREIGRIFELGLDLVKTYVRFPDTLQQGVVEAAHRRGLFVTSHEVYPAVAYGVDGIEHIRGTSRRGFSPKVTELRRSYRDVIDLIAGSGVYFTPTLAIQGGFRLALAREPLLLEDPRFDSLYPVWARSFFTAVRDEPVAEREEVMRPLLATIDAVSKAGGRVLAGTDSPIVPYGLGLVLEVEMLAEAGLGALQAIHSATGLAADALGAGEDLGTVEPGKLADLVILSRNPMEDIRNLRTAEQVILNGRLLSVSRLLREEQAKTKR